MSTRVQLTWSTEAGYALPRSRAIFGVCYSAGVKYLALLLLALAACTPKNPPRGPTSAEDALRAEAARVWVEQGWPSPARCPVARVAVLDDEGVDTLCSPTAAACAPWYGGPVIVMRRDLPPSTYVHEVLHFWCRCLSDRDPELWQCYYGDDADGGLHPPWFYRIIQEVSGDEG